MMSENGLHKFQYGAGLFAKSAAGNEFNNKLPIKSTKLTNRGFGWSYLFRLFC